MAKVRQNGSACGQKWNPYLKLSYTSFWGSNDPWLGAGNSRPAPLLETRAAGGWQELRTGSSSPGWLPGSTEVSADQWGRLGEALGEGMVRARCLSPSLAGQTCCCFSPSYTCTLIFCTQENDSCLNFLVFFSVLGCLTKTREMLIFHGNQWQRKQVSKSSLHMHL